MQVGDIHLSGYLFFSGQVEVVLRGCEMSRLWRIMYYTEDGLVEVVEVVRKRRPTKLAKALMCDEFTHFEIRQVASWQAVKGF